MLKFDSIRASQLSRRDQTVRLPARTPPLVESRHGLGRLDRRCRPRRVVRLAYGADRESAGAVGEVDARGGDRIAPAVFSEFWTCLLDDRADRISRSPRCISSAFLFPDRICGESIERLVRCNFLVCVYWKIGREAPTAPAQTSR